MQRDKKIIFLFNCPFLESYVNKYCLWELPSLGYFVSVLDLSRVLEPEYNKNTSAEISDDVRFEILIMESYHQIEEYIQKNKTDTIFFPMFDYIYSARKVFSLFTKYNINYIYVNSLLSPLFAPSGRENKIRINIKTLSISHLRGVFFHRIVRKILTHKQAKSIFFCGEKAEDFYFSEGACGKDTKRKYLYSFDYENLIQTNPYDNSGRNYCVFIDQYIPYHPDNIVHKKIIINPDIYYGELESMLNVIGQKLNLDIIIACHPQANYDDKKYFQDYKIEYGQTASLVKNADIICTHFSTAGIYAVMLKKPLILLNLNTLHSVQLFQNAFRSISDSTGAKIIEDINQVSKSDLTCIDFEKYSKCMIENISRCCPDGRYLWERVMELI